LRALSRDKKVGRRGDRSASNPRRRHQHARQAYGESDPAEDVSDILTGLRDDRFVIAFGVTASRPTAFRRGAARLPGVGYQKLHAHSPIWRSGSSGDEFRSPRAISASTSKYEFSLESPMTASAYLRSSSTELLSHRQNTEFLSARIELQNAGALWCAVAVQQVLPTRERCLRVRDAVLEDDEHEPPPGESGLSLP
jgi:hypothetical protein